MVYNEKKFKEFFKKKNQKLMSSFVALFNISASSFSGNL